MWTRDLELAEENWYDHILTGATPRRGQLWPIGVVSKFTLTTETGMMAHNFDADTPPVADTAQTVDFVSQFGADAAAGTGLQELQIIGMNGANDFARETLELNGATPVPTAQSYRTILTFWANRVGTNGLNAGRISCEQTTSGHKLGRMEDKVMTAEIPILAAANNYRIYVDWVQIVGNDANHREGGLYLHDGATGIKRQIVPMDSDTGYASSGGIVNPDGIVSVQRWFNGPSWVYPYFGLGGASGRTIRTIIRGYLQYTG